MVGPIIKFMMRPTVKGDYVFICSLGLRNNFPDYETRNKKSLNIIFGGVQ